MKLVRFNHKDRIYYGYLKNSYIEVLSSEPWNDGKITGEKVDLENIRLLAPCQPNKILCTAINYPGATGQNSSQKEPLVFIKTLNTVIGDKDSIISPFENLNIWGEPELAIVISKKLKNANESDVINAIYGYTIANDVTTDNLNDWDHHLARSKCIDTFCALGPYIDTDFVPDNQEIIGLHNNELLRKGILSDRISKEPDLLVSLSKWITLEPGDVILSGTPTRIKDRIYFKNDDIFECAIEGLGSIQNPFKFKK